MQTTLPIVKETFIKAPASKVWKALTDKEQMKSWYFEVSDFKAEEGFEFSFWGENEGRKYLHLCTVKEVIVNKKLSYTWKYDGYEGDSLVTFNLLEEDGGTRVQLTHTGLETFSHQHKDFAPENFNAGWTYIIEAALKEYSEKGTVVSAG
jgi:uncharacterized protein YndB with AHSA1/START domain